MSFADEVIRWSEANRRDFPWRRTRDPWAVLVSEIMLQQTQADRVVARYGRFIEEFPTVAACARSPRSSVVRAWAGLGYNRRAVALHRAAGLCVERHGGGVPDRLEDLLALPGVGEYTARAVLAFAFEKPAGVIDTNVARVLARCVAGAPMRRGEAQALADALLPAGMSWAWNQGMLDLGAVHCRARPRCVGCPVAARCTWASAGRPDPDPAISSHGTSGRQSTFDGSDRQGRGRLIAALRAGPLSTAEAPARAGWPDEPERTQRVVDALKRDGLIHHDEQRGLLSLA